ncbi:NmrA family NAD(P)-binding protein [Pseudomonas sp. 7P_10.2_Bac1]|uniref:NmrA family NAD(P)-binding protein n=1 Tax=Pseudomonas sp. 7P_10.2_Bac1 TaxID=2971614 RepID=UPI0021C8769D|nr:NmrA family NAD(P)-binding protein [Pseudomonas sp. 7P_10.2_Bac1]MCU1727393.1 NmrA family NAD(P)-binding protein [Pseudomonas sp. 7P_10.2_Bac1]
MTNVLILGATGNLGILTAETLTQEYPAVKLRLASSRPEGVTKLKERFADADVVQADWYDPESLFKAVNGVDKVFIVTPDFVTDELQVTPNIINAIKRAGSACQVIRFIAIPPGLTSADLTPEFLATRCGANLHTLAKPLLDASGLPVTYINAACWIMFNLPWFVAADVKNKREFVMPSISDAPRLHLSEHDIAAVVAKVISDNIEQHAGQHYLITGTERLDYRQVTDLISEVIKDKVTYVDSDQSLRVTLGEYFEPVMTYYRHEVEAYKNVPVTDTVQQITGRPTTTLREYLMMNKHLFV